MNSYFSEAGSFLIETIFGFFILLVMLRFILQSIRADFYNPLSQFIVKITDPLLKPLRRIIPGFGGVDIASIVLMLLLKIMSILLIILIAGKPMHIAVIAVLTVGGLISLAIYVFIFSIFIMAIISWISPGGYNPVLALIQQITEPVMRPIRRYVKPVSGLDLSPMIALLLLYLVAMAIPHLQRSILGLFV